MRLLLRGLSLLVLAALAGLSVGVVPASAHSRLRSMSPADGASVPTSPTEVVLTFNEEVNPQFVTVRLTDGEGTVVAEDATADGTVVTLPVPEPVSAGPYKVTYRVVSADSHPISGSTTFTVAGDPQASPTAAPQSPSASPTTPGGSATTSPSSPVADPSPTASAAAGDAESAGSDGASPVVWVVALALLAAVVAAVVLARRRERPEA